MTGFGEDVRQNENTAVTVEVRAVNNRYLKITLRCSDGCPTLEPQIESLVRRHLKRGTVQVNVRVRQVSTPDHYRVNEDVLDGYRQQLENIQRRWDCSDPIPAVALLQLPGVVDDQQPVGETNEVWSVVEPALTTALENLVAMRIE
ncbi:MAG: YicC/YloC family endoribonuclease, partial [Pirellulales bacterium]